MMRKIVCIILLFWLCVAVESQNQREWKRIQPAKGSDLIQFTASVKYLPEGIDKLKRIVENISDPLSNDYGKYFTSRKELREIVGPTKDTCVNAISFIEKYDPFTITQMADCAYLQIQMTVENFRQMFVEDLDLSWYQLSHRSKNKEEMMSDKHLLCEVDHYPTLLHRPEHIEMITGCFLFPDMVTTERSKTFTHFSENHQLDNARGKQKRAMEQHSEQKWDDSSSENAPLFGNSPVIAGDSQIFITATAKCKNGAIANTTTDGQPLCANNPPIISSMIATLKNLDNGKIAEIGPEGNDGFFTETNGLCLLSISNGILPQQRYSLSLQTVYADNSYSDSADYNFTIATTPLLTPSLVKKFYGIPQGAGFYANKSNSMACSENAYYYQFRQSDVALFQQWNGLPTTNVPNIGGPSTNPLKNPTTEGSLDIQWLLSLAPSVNATFWNVAGVDDFELQWALSLLNAKNPPIVNALSWGGPSAQNATYFQRVDSDLLQLASLGITIVVSSGDAGATNIGRNGPYTCNVFSPRYPAQSPYVTAVGGTIQSTMNLPVCQQRIYGVLSNPLCSSVGEVNADINAGIWWTAGGGFSSYAPAPKYQSVALNGYLNQMKSKLIPSPPSSMFNSSNRAYPDISLLAQNQLITFYGTSEIVAGTSASTPMFASMLALINNELLNRQLPRLGFLNPLLYYLNQYKPECFQDIVVGSNYCGSMTCCNKNQGFYATQGFDSVTGIGSPRNLDRSL